MGRQWLLSKRMVVSQRKAQATTKLVREIMVAAKLGGSDPDLNARLAAAIEKAKKESVSRDIIDRAIKKGSGQGEDKMTMETVVFEGYTPHKVPLIVEAMTDNLNRTVPEIRVLFRNGQLGTTGSNKFLFEQVGLVEAYRSEPVSDLEEVAIEAGANEVELLETARNDDIPEEATGARFLTERTSTHEVSTWLSKNGWKVVTSEPGYVAKNYPELNGDQMQEVGEFLQALEDHDDVHRVWAALK